MFQVRQVNVSDDDLLSSEDFLGEVPTEVVLADGVGELVPEGRLSGSASLLEESVGLLGFRSLLEVV